MSSNAAHFRLFVEAPSPDADSVERSADYEAGRPRLPWIEVPSSGPSYLATDPGKPPQVVTSPPPPSALASVLETVPYERQVFLAAFAQGNVRRNGLPMPPMAILHVGDTLRVDGGWVLHVSRFTRAHVGPPPAEWIGKPCSYCRVEFVPTTITYVCPHCGAAFHCESEAAPSDPALGPLECARWMASCHHCYQPVVLEERYEHVPDA